MLTRRTPGLTLALSLTLAALIGCGPPPGGDDGGTADAAVDGGLDGGSDGGDGGWVDPNPPQATWSWIEAEIVPGCASQGNCHLGAVTSGLDLSGGGALAAMRGVQSGQVSGLSLIEPFDAAASYLVRKLEGTHTQACLDAGLIAALCGELMPPAGMISQGRRDAVVQWINEGAQDN